MTAGEVRAFILELVSGSLPPGTEPDALPPEFDLMDSGSLDSLGLLELVTAIEDRCGVEIDFEELDPEIMTQLGPLSGYVADRLDIDIHNEC